MDAQWARQKNPENRPSPHKNCKKLRPLEKNGPFFSNEKKAENGQMVGAKKNAVFFYWRSQKKKEGHCTFFGNRNFDTLLPTLPMSTE